MFTSLLGCEHWVHYQKKDAGVSIMKLFSDILNLTLCCYVISSLLCVARLHALLQFVGSRFRMQIDSYRSDHP